MREREIAEFHFRNANVPPRIQREVRLNAALKRAVGKPRARFYNAMYICGGCMVAPNHWVVRGTTLLNLLETTVRGYGGSLGGAIVAYQNEIALIKNNSPVRFVNFDVLVKRDEPLRPPLQKWERWR
jgi:hypothetical protein